MRRDNVVLRVSLALLFAFAACSTFPAARAADHRDAPAINGAGEGDIGDVFAFRDPNDPSRIVIAMGVNPFSIPGVSSGYRFSPDYLYQFKIDIDGDYREDFVIQFRFEDTPTGQIVHEAHGVPIAGYIGAVNRAIPDQFGLVGPVGTVLGNSNETQVWCGQADDPFVVDLDRKSVV